MIYTKKTIPTQQLPTGEVLMTHAYNFDSGLVGKKIYIQANLHGPEVFGTALLTKLIEYLEEKTSITGSVCVVPCANPIAVQQKSYNALTGRSNPISGTNWNRIFTVDKKWKSPKEQETYYLNQLKKSNGSIEESVAANLMLLSIGSDVILDIHTTGNKTAPHIFTHKKSVQVFAALDPMVHILWEKDVAIGAFDESHVIPFLETLPFDKIPHAATWEVDCHGTIDKEKLNSRFVQLIEFLEMAWQNKKTNPSKYVPLNQHNHLHAPIAGYYSWLVEPGSTVQKNQPYATVFQPWVGKSTTLFAPEPFILIGTYGIAATGAGEQIGLCVFL